MKKIGYLVALLTILLIPISANAATTVDTKTIAHTHTNACKTSTIIQYQPMEQSDDGNHSTIYYECTECNYRWTTNWDNGVSTNLHDKCPHCGKSTKLTCTHSTCGTISMELNGTKLKIVSTSSGAGLTITGYEWSGKGSGTGSNITATATGTYKCKVSYKDNKTNATGTCTLTYTLSNPEIQSVTVPTGYATYKDIVINATNATKYSIDGTNYQTSNTFGITTNGSYTAYAKDNADKIATKSFTVSDIDATTPNLTVSASTSKGTYTSGWTNENVTVECTDSVRHLSVDSEVKIGSTVLTSGDHLSTDGYSYTRVSNDPLKERVILSKSGTVTFKVTTGAGLSQTKSFTVQIDKDKPTKPEITAVVQNNKVKLTITSTDTNIDKIISNATIAQSKSGNKATATATIDASGTYTFKAIDLAGNESEVSTYVVQYPVIESIYQTEAWNTCKTVAINALYADEYSLDGNTWQAEHSYTLNTNGSYTAYVRNSSGLIATQTFEVTKVDASSPNLSLSVRENGVPYQRGTWAKDNLTIKVIDNVVHPSGATSFEWEYYDAVDLAHIGAQIGTPMGTGDTITAKKTGLYVCIATTKTGIMATTSTHVMIDKTAPTIPVVSYEDEWTNESVLVTIMSSDSNLKEFHLCKDAETTIYETTTGSIEVTIEENGEYEVKAIDLAGNESEATFTISCIDKTIPVVTFEESTHTKSSVEGTIHISDKVDERTEDTLDTVEIYLNNVFVEDYNLTENPADLSYSFKVNGTWKIVAYDKAGNSGEKIFSIEDLERIFTLDERADLLHIHSDKKGACYKEEYTYQNVPKYVECVHDWEYTKNYNADTCPICGSPAHNGGWIETSTYNCGKQLLGSYTASSVLHCQGGCGWSSGPDPKPSESKSHKIKNGTERKKVKTYVLDCEDLKEGTITLRKDTSSEYRLYFDTELDNAEIISYKWSAKNTEKTTKNIQTGSTAAEHIVTDFGDYFCDIKWKDTKSNKTFTYTFWHRVDDYDSEAPTVSYHVTNCGTENTIVFEVKDNVKLASLKEGNTLIRELNGKTDSFTLTLTSGEHLFSLYDEAGNKLNFTIHETYVKDATTIDNNLCTINVLAYPFSYDTDGEVKPCAEVVGYALQNSDGSYGEYQAGGVFGNIWKNGSYIIKVKDSIGNEMTYRKYITGLSEQTKVTYIDRCGQETLDTQTRFKAIGDKASGSELGTSTTEGFYHKGYVYKDCTSITVGFGVDNVVYRNFVLAEYLVEYFDDTGKKLAEETVEYGGRNTVTLIPTKASVEEDSYTIDYYFVGWVDRFGIEVDLTDIRENLQCYPLFEELREDDIHTVTFYHDYANNPEEKTIFHVPNKSEVNPPYVMKNPTEDIYYEFKCWTLANGEVVNDFSCITSDCDFFAVYTEYEIYKEEETEDISDLLWNEADPITIEPEPHVWPHKEIEEEEAPTGVVTKFIDDNKETIKKVAKTTGITGILLALLELLSFLLTGFGIIQLIIFLYNLIKNNRRYVQGAWLTDDPTMEYVDKHGHTLERRNGMFYLKDKPIKAVDVNEEIKKLNRCSINYKQFKEHISHSAVYTVFNKNLQIECANVKNTYESKVHGFSIVRTLNNLIKTAGNYRVKIKNNNKEFIYNLSVAINGNKI